MAAPLRVKSLFEYSSPHEDDLNFAVGQVITVTDDDDPEWYGGEYVDSHGVKKEGIFPRNFVEKFEPTAPPRPARSRPKKESDALQSPQEATAAAPTRPLSPNHDAAQPQQPDSETTQAPAEAASAHGPMPLPSQPDEPAPTMPSAPTAPKTSEPRTLGPPPPSPATKNKPSAPPPVSDKPVSSSFKDRIAAFNKAAAPPIAPFKPSGLGGAGGSSTFVKKPFVAPPPSRNAYVPPPRDPPTPTAYKRQEDPEIREREAQNLQNAEKAGLVPTDQAQSGADQDQPKPTSLKERIALLQKQQMEQASRHAEAAAKKEKPKKPPKKRTESTLSSEAVQEAIESGPSVVPERAIAEDIDTPTESRSAIKPAPAPRRKSSKGPTHESVHDGNEADMSGAGDTTEGQDDTTEREDSDGTPRHVSRADTTSTMASGGKEESDDDATAEAEGEEEVDPEIRRKEELRARMAKMSGGMGFHGMFGAPMPPVMPVPSKKKETRAEGSGSTADGGEAAGSSTYIAPPIPTPMALPGFGGPRQADEEEAVGSPRAPPPALPVRSATVDTVKQVDESEEEEEEQEEQEQEQVGEEEEEETVAPAPLTEPQSPSAPLTGSSSRAAPPPVPAETSRIAAVDAKSGNDGFESDDEMSGGAREADVPNVSVAAARSPPMLPQAVQSPGASARSPPLSPRGDDASPTSPSVATHNRSSRLPPPVPGSAPAIPPAHTRPPPPPPPGGLLRRQSTADTPVAPSAPVRPLQVGEDGDEEVTEYEGDYDTDIASSVPHKDALKAHARDSSHDQGTAQSPVAEAPTAQPPPLPSASAPRAVPPPVPVGSSSDSSKRRSIDAPRAAPPPPPPTIKEGTGSLDEAGVDSYNYANASHAAATPGFSHRTPKIEEEAPRSPAVSPVERRAPPGNGRGRPSMDVPRTSMSNRRSVDLHRPSMESGFIANDIDLAVQSGWWKQANQVPPALQGRRDICFESQESTSTNQGAKTVTTREILVLYQDYSQTVLTVRFDPYDPSDVELEQRHEPPPRALRQDQMEQYYDSLGRRISEAAAARKDSVVGDGTPQSLVLELLRPLKEALGPVGTRAYGALVYSNLANASTQQHDVIRPGDIMTTRNAKFQGKHGAMHAKYSVEVGKPDHVGVVAEWDGTKKKVRVWEQGRESKKVKLESFKLDDLRSGEVKIWRVVPRSWVGWET
ncbi:hypothetical protein CDD82_451 [Ophiocordyceps australis]|uniref:SH3 domain-containing protein n=1 Tax=Ophiocordyceps australis TaxID=1399860 RepID=A0A2C5ZUE4_9HYPO|nr:hypothetical protein CDD82_451 [Ophiocordyceps australis]